MTEAIGDIGESLIVEYSLFNNLEEVREEDIKLVIENGDGEVVAQDTISLDGGEESEETLSWESSEEDEGLYEARVESDGDSESFPMIVAGDDYAGYLRDDWGDNELENRTLTYEREYEGVDGVHRPNWTVDGNEPLVRDGTLEIRDGDGVTSEINLNLNETVAWEIDREYVGVSDSAAGVSVILFAETNNVFDENRSMERGYGIYLRDEDVGSIIRRYDEGTTENIEVGVDIGNSDLVEVKREAGGYWEILADGETVYEFEDNTYDNPAYLSFRSRDGEDAEIDVNEMRVF